MRPTVPRYTIENFQTPGTAGSESSAVSVPVSNNSARQSRRSRSRIASAAAAVSQDASQRHVNLVAICENKAREIGMACLNLTLSQLVFCQFTDKFNFAVTFAQLQLFAPREILVPHTTSGSPLCAMMRERLGASCDIADVNRKFFNEAKGTEYLRSLAASPIACDRNKYLSLAAVAAVINYAEYVQQTAFPNRSLKVTYRAVEGFMHLDPETIANLELVRNLRTGDSKSSLFGLINFTKTAGGARLLRASLLQPLCDIPTIETRLDCIAELLRNEKAYFEITGFLADFLDLDHLASLQFTHSSAAAAAAAATASAKATLHTCEQAIANMIYLKQSLDVAEKLRLSLQGMNQNAGPQNALFRAIASNLLHAELQMIRDEINRLIEPDAHKRAGAVAMRTERYFAVKAGCNGLLDVARKTFVEVLDDVMELLAEYTKQFMMDGLRLKNNAKRGYFFSLSTASKVNPRDFDVFIHVQQQHGAYNFTSEELESFNERLRESGAEISLLTAKVIDELGNFARQHLASIHALSDSVSLLDMVTAFTTWVTLSEQMVRPEVIDGGPIAIKQAVHPIVAGLQPDISFVPNDTYISAVNNFFLITGQNMSGKSTYIKQVALITILAHCGCYVPAAWASVRLTDRVFTRIGNDDDIEHNSSTFLVEMREVAHICHNATRRSLVIVDELGRGTSVTDGVSIAWAVSELLLSLPCYTLFTTHYQQLLRLALLYPNVKCFAVELDSSLRPSFRLHEASPNAQLDVGYGLRAAMAAGLPQQVVERAQAVREAMSSATASLKTGTDAPAFQAAEKVLLLRNSQLDSDSMHEYLLELKKTFAANAN